MLSQMLGRQILHNWQQGQWLSPRTRLCNIIKGMRRASINHVFLECQDTLLFWDVPRRTLKKNIYMNPHTFHYFPVNQVESIKYDVLIILVLYSIWLLRMSVSHADNLPKQVYAFFVECTMQLIADINYKMTITMNGSLFWSRWTFDGLRG